MSFINFTDAWLKVAGSSDACGCILAIVRFDGFEYHVSTRIVDVQGLNGRNLHFDGSIINDVVLSEEIDPFDRSAKMKSADLEVPLTSVPAIELRQRGVIFQRGEVDLYWHVDGVGMTLSDSVFFMRGRVDNLFVNEEGMTCSIRVVEHRLQGDLPFPPIISDVVRFPSIVEESAGKCYPIIINAAKKVPGIDIDNAAPNKTFLVMDDPFGAFESSTTQVSKANDEDVLDVAINSQASDSDNEDRLYYKCVLNAAAASNNVTFDVTGYSINSFKELMQFLFRFSAYRDMLDPASLEVVSLFMGAIDYSMIVNEQIQGGILSLVRDRLSEELPFQLVQNGSKFEFVGFRWDKDVKRTLSFDKGIVRKTGGPEETPRSEVFTNFQVRYGHSGLRDEFLGAVIRNELNCFECRIASEYYGYNAKEAHEARDISNSAGASFLSAWLVETYGRMRLRVSYEVTAEFGTLYLWDTIKVFDDYEGWEDGVYFKVVGIHRGTGPTITLDLLSVDDVMKIYQAKVDAEDPFTVSDAEFIDNFTVDVEFNMDCEANADLTDASNYVLSGGTATAVNSAAIISARKVRLTTDYMIPGEHLTVTVSDVITDDDGESLRTGRDFANFTVIGVLPMPKVDSMTALGLDSLYLVFDIDMENNAALVDTANYVFTGPTSPTTLSVTRLNATTVQIAVDMLTPGGSYTVTVSNVISDGGAPIDPAHDSIVFTAPTWYSCGIICYYKFNRDVLDYSTNGYDGTLEKSERDWSMESFSTKPTGRQLPGVVYDSANSVIVLFGGLDGATAYQDTWIYNGSTWSDVTPGGSKPSVRWAPGMAYDANRGKVVLFGGSNFAFGNNQETWEWDTALGTWSQIIPNPLNQPSARRGPFMEYDAANTNVVLFGGYDGAAYKQDTYTWDGVTWTTKAPGGSIPSIRAYGSMCWDSGNSRILLFGGQNAGAKLNDSFEYDGTDWADVSPAAISRPTVRAGAGMAYDVDAGHVIMFAGLNVGYNQETWKWERGAPGTWTSLSPISKPQSRKTNCVYFPPKKFMLCFTGLGASYYDDVWVFGNYTNGKVDRGIILDGTGSSGGNAIGTRQSMIISSSVDTAILNTEKFTVMGWIKPHEVSIAARMLTIVAKRYYDGANNQGTFYFSIKKNSNVLQAWANFTGGAISVDGGSALTASTLYHVALTLGADKKLRIYLNGAIDATSAAGVGTLTNSEVASRILFGASQYTATNQRGDYFDGVLDAFKIYDRQLNVTEILTDYNGGSGLEW